MAEYILRPPKAEGEDGYILKAPEKPMVVKAGEMIMEAPRQLGLAARYGIEGLADVAQIGTEPIRAIINPALRAVGLPAADSLRNTVSGYLDKAGLPNPETPTERVVGDASRLVAGSMGLGGVAGKTAEAVTNPVGQRVLRSLSSNMGAQGVSAATAGVAGGSTREAGGGPAAQFGASLVGGLAGAGATALGQKLYGAVSDAIKNLMRPNTTQAQINVTLNNILEQNGIDISAVDSSVRSELYRRVREAMDTGAQLNPDVIRRIADYGAVGATPTRGTVTLDPGIITRERNLAKVGANSSDENLQQLSNIQNQNNATLIRNLNEMGGATPNTNPTVAGERVIGAVARRDAAAQATERALYDRARESGGRQITLDHDGFVYDAYRRLADANKGAFLPPEIAKVLEQLRVGKQVLPDGREVPMPFTVDTIDNIKTMLATATRASKDGNVRTALSQVRSALDDVRPSATGNPPTGNTLPVNPEALAAAQSQADNLGAESLAAFDRARNYARARRTWQESAAGIRAALDDPNSDRFVQDYIISRGNNASTAEVERLLHTVRRDPEAMAAVKENVVAYLKRAALGSNPEDAANFSSSNFNQALNNIGELKLRLFFNPQELAQLRAVGRVAGYETAQPRGSAINNSNSAATLGGWAVDMLNRLSSSRLVSRIPMGDSLVRTPAQNWSQQLQVGAALDPYSAAVRVPGSSADVVRLSDLLGPGLMLAAPKSDSRNK